MALHSPKDFQDFCGISVKHFSTYVGRKKIVLSGGLVDDRDPVNAAFIQKRLKIKEKSPKPEAKKEEKIKNDSKSEPQKDNNPGEYSEIDREKLPYFELERQKKLADLIKVEADTRLSLLKEEKLMGLSIPTDLVKSLISQLSKSIISSFKDGADGFLIEISKLKSLNNTEVAEMRGQLVRIINNSTAKAINESKINMKAIVNNYSEKKEVGEHE